MTLARLAALLLFCCLPAVAQQSTDFFAVDKSAKTLPDFSTLRDAPSQPWQIVPNPPAELSSGQDHIRVDQFRLDQGKVYTSAPTFTFKAASALGRFTRRRCDLLHHAQLRGGTRFQGF